MKSIPQFLISAPSSGSGKTTISRAIMQALHNRGLSVQPFKCGPDYIDTKFHSLACQRGSVNLDSFMASPNHIKSIYSHYCQDADAAIVEGMMGMFDGYCKDAGSTAEVAAILNIPIVLVVDAKSAAYSVAPLLQGFKNFSQKVNILGVIFNKTGSQRHLNMLKEVCSDVDICYLGGLPYSGNAEQPSRYLGLDFSANSSISEFVKLIEENIDLNSIIKLSTRELPPQKEFMQYHHRVLIAQSEESFSFTYREHLDRWPNKLFFNPEEDKPINQDIDLLYLPGGYPEKHLEKLSRATKTIASIREYAQSGGKILAECGGMAYLCKCVENEDGRYELCNILPYTVDAKKEARKLSLGYRKVLFESGGEFNGHEFHYTQFKEMPQSSVAEVYNARGERVNSPIFRAGNVICGYPHLYWGAKDIMTIFQ